MLDRRDFLKLAGVAAGFFASGSLTACSVPFTMEGRPKAGDGAEQGRLLSRPAPRASDATAKSGLRPLGLGSDRDGLLYVPAGYDASEGAPLALTLHGAGGNARSGISHFLDLADEFGLVLLSPESRGRTWDVLLGGYGPDVEFIDRALEQTFGRLSVDAARLAATGFSDGASYALSLGLTNGDLFSHLIAFSAGFMSPAARRGEPSVFVSHGTRDEVLPIERTGRRIVPMLRREGYEVRYREFDGPHAVPRSIARGALEWFTTDRRAP